jgi:hypothetical protein
MLEEARREDVEVGAWLNVIGYVSVDNASVNIAIDQTTSLVRVDALRIWNTGSIQLSAYEDAVRARQHTEGTA